MTVHHTPAVEPEAQRPLGDRLRQLRLERGLSLDDVSRATRVSLANLRAIETGAHERLPADVFAKGLVVLYATHLGLDGPRAGEQFLLERHAGAAGGPPARQHLNAFSPLPKKLAEPPHVSSAAVATILFVVIVLSFTGFCLTTSWNPFAFLTDRIFGVSSAITNSFHPADPATGNGAPSKAINLSVHFQKDVEVAVTLDGSAPLRQRHGNGTFANWSADRRLEIEFFQPESAELRLNGTPLPFPPGRNGRHILRLPPDPNTP